MDLKDQTTAGLVALSKKALSDPATVRRSLRRSNLLPGLFRIKGQPFNLADYPQFRPLYDEHAFVPEMVLLCGRQVTKSSNASTSSTLNMLSIPSFKVLYVAPLREQAVFYGNEYLRDRIETSPVLRAFQDVRNFENPTPVTRAVMQRGFANGSVQTLTYAKTSADRARGKPADQIDFDELQDQQLDNLSIIKQSLTNSRYGLARYYGTAKTRDNTIQYYFDRSSRGEWLVRCRNNHDNIPTLDNNVLRMIGPNGPICHKCETPLDVTNGFFEHADKGKLSTFVGLHIPQIFLPAIANDPVRWRRLFREAARQDLTRTIQEILGISYNIGARELDQSHIDAASVLPSVVDLRKQLHRYVMIVGGIDWGIAEVTSFTVHTILGFLPDGTAHVLWAKRYQAMNVEDMLKDIASAHSIYHCQLLAADIGVGHAQNRLLRSMYGIEMVQMNYTAQRRFMVFRPLLDEPRWMLDKLTSLKLMFSAIRNGHILFPKRPELDKFCSDLLSPYEDITVTNGVEHRKLLRNPAVPDDFAHAINFAYVVGQKACGIDLSSRLSVHASGYGLEELDLYDAVEQDDIDPMEAMRSQIG